MKNTSRASIAWPVALITIVSVCSTACSGANAEGHTYTGNGGIVKIEFKSDGKAFVSTGPITTACTYSESNKSVSLDCEGDNTEFTIDQDGALIGPPGGMLARLTKEN